MRRAALGARSDRRGARAGGRGSRAIEGHREVTRRSADSATPERDAFRAARDVFVWGRCDQRRNRFRVRRVIK